MCTNLLYDGMVDGSLSAVAEHTYINSFKLGWVFEVTNGNIILLTREYLPDMEPTGLPNITTVYHLDAGSHIIGQPSLAFDQSGRAHIALVLFHDTTPVVRSVKYIHYTSTFQDTCNIGSTRYDCETIKLRFPSAWAASRALW